MARFTKKIRLILILAAFLYAVSVPVQAAPYVEQGDIESYAKLREVERYQIKIAQKFYQAADYKAAGAEFEKFLTLYERSTGGPYALMMWAHCQIHLRLVNTAIRDGFQPFDEFIKNIYFDTAIYDQNGLELLLKVAGIDNVLFASEMIGAVNAIDPLTGRYFDDIKPIVDNIDWLTEEHRTKLFEGNVLKVYPRLKNYLK